MNFNTHAHTPTSTALLVCALDRGTNPGVVGVGVHVFVSICGRCEWQSSRAEF